MADLPTGITDPSNYKRAAIGNGYLFNGLHDYMDIQTASAQLEKLGIMAVTHVTPEGQMSLEIKAPLGTDAKAYLYQAIGRMQPHPAAQAEASQAQTSPASPQYNTRFSGLPHDPRIGGTFGQQPPAGGRPMGNIDNTQVERPFETSLTAGQAPAAIAALKAKGIDASYGPNHDGKPALLVKEPMATFHNPAANDQFIEKARSAVGEATTQAQQQHASAEPQTPAASQTASGAAPAAPTSEMGMLMASLHQDVAACGDKMKAMFAGNTNPPPTQNAGPPVAVAAAQQASRGMGGQGQG